MYAFWRGPRGWASGWLYIALFRRVPFDSFCHIFRGQGTSSASVCGVARVSRSSHLQLLIDPTQQRLEHNNGQLSLILHSVRASIIGATGVANMVAQTHVRRASAINATTAGCFNVILCVSTSFVYTWCILSWSVKLRRTIGAAHSCAAPAVVFLSSVWRRRSRMKEHFHYIVLAAFFCQLSHDSRLSARLRWRCCCRCCCC